MNEAALTAGPTLTLTKITAAEMAANALVIRDWILRIDMAGFLFYIRDDNQRIVAALLIAGAMLAPANITVEKIAATVANRLVGILCVNIV